MQPLLDEVLQRVLEVHRVVWVCVQQVLLINETDDQLPCHVIRTIVFINQHLELLAVRKE